MRSTRGRQEQIVYARAPVSVVVSFPGRTTPAMRFCLARREMNRALLAWLQTGPAAHDVAGEIADTIALLRQLQQLQPYIEEEPR